MKKKTVFIAEDGREFDDQQACNNYEKMLKSEKAVSRYLVKKLGLKNSGDGTLSSVFSENYDSEDATHLGQKLIFAILMDFQEFSRIVKGGKTQGRPPKNTEEVPVKKATRKRAKKADTALVTAEPPASSTPKPPAPPASTSGRADIPPPPPMPPE